MDNPPHRDNHHGGTLLLERSATLAPDPMSPRLARKILRDALGSVGDESWMEAGELAMSEVVTNAVLHAHTDIGLSIFVYSHEVCVEVKDSNPALPIARDYDEEASTGRGLALIATLSTKHGIESLGADGKVIWFCIGGAEADERSPEDILAAWDVEDWPDAPVADDLAPVVLRNMPPTLWLSARQHHDALLRELALYASQHPIDVDLGEADRARSSISIPVAQAVEHAHAAGLTRPVLPDGHPSPLPWAPESLDLELHVARADAGGYLALAEALDLAEELAVAGELLARPGLPEVIAVRDWACEQVVAQLAGSPAAPWTGTDQERFETEANGPLSEATTEDLRIVADSDRGVVAADEANRIVAISESLAQALGWDRSTLVGRRVVTLIPPRLREAHVAGFTRHLATGEAHVLGVPLELPVLRFDGTEVRCRFLIERADVPSPRPLYFAWIEPIDE